MLPDAKIHQLIASQFPALPVPTAAAPGAAILSFTRHTRQAIRRGRIEEVRKCFAMAGVLYRNGSSLVRTAIENVFLFSISPFLDGRGLKLFLPASLRAARNSFVQSIH
ncbi:DUF7674 family protein [Chitinophaga lutea]